MNCSSISSGPWVRPLLDTRIVSVLILVLPSPDLPQLEGPVTVPLPSVRQISPECWKVLSHLLMGLSPSCPEAQAP